LFFLIWLFFKNKEIKFSEDGKKLACLAVLMRSEKTMLHIFDVEKDGKLKKVFFPLTINIKKKSTIK